MPISATLLHTLGTLSVLYSEPKHFNNLAHNVDEVIHAQRRIYKRKKKLTPFYVCEAFVRHCESAI